MKIKHKDLKRGEIRVEAETPEDLWLLSEVIREGDVVEGTAERKVKVGTGKDKTARKKGRVRLRVEKAEFEGKKLRINGKIESGPEEFPRGNYQSITLKERGEIKVVKEKWHGYEVKKLEESRAKNRTLIVVFNREEAVFGKIGRRGCEVLSRIKGDVKKKRRDVEGENFFKRISESIKKYLERDYENVVVASPGFWNEYLEEELDSETKKVLIKAKCNRVGEEGLREVMKRPELEKSLKNARERKELRVVEDMLKSLREDKASYGVEEAEKSAERGRTERLVVSESFLKRKREEASGFQRVEEIMREVEEKGGEVVLISTKDAERRVDGLGGVISVDRW